jgi:hypothetical protein
MVDGRESMVPVESQQSMKRCVVVGVVIAIAHAITIQGQVISAGGGTQAISPAVVATILTRQERDKPPELELLVLWRGTPGWFMQAQGGGGGMSSGGNGGGGIGDGGRGPVYQRMFFGSLSFELEFDPQKQTAKIQGREVSLQNANVILVDDVDSAGGPQILGTRWVEPHLAAGPMGVESIIQRSPELFEFLRCDAILADIGMQQMMNLQCARMRGQ